MHPQTQFCKLTHLFLSSLAFQASLWQLTKYAFIFNMKDKIQIHTMECIGLSIRGISDIRMDTISCTVEQECWIFPVRRQYLLQDTWTYLKNAPTQQFKKALQVRHQIVLLSLTTLLQHSLFFGVTDVLIEGFQ